MSGEEYLGPKEDFWAKRTMEFDKASGKAVANVRTIVTRLYKDYLSDPAEACPCPPAR